MQKSSAVIAEDFLWDADAFRPGCYTQFVDH